MELSQKPSNLIDKMRRISTGIFPGYPVLFAYLYGSFATDTTHPFSDLDIGAYLKPEASESFLEIELDLALEIDQHLGHVIETDVRAINNLPLMFVGRILTEGILIYSRDESARVEFEVLTRKKYFDFMPVINEYHKAYIDSVLSRSDKNG
ncbi:MAG: nucleotidyltransferase domain-containing protein [Desulfobacteraceae bacterium]|nr:nucleotidyltransferase domain-containing protein [Desulfobacteraceae bacterium]MCF8095891.1 nucleotidyltransferase domain-containing protein [Desulfobacteraceae bacterium]